MESNTDNPLVTIVIPAYNTADYILEAIDSVLRQTYAPIELIVVDDGSTDNTQALLDAHPGDFKRFRQDNAGQSAAMNFGWKEGSGPIMGYLSADDRLHPEAVATLVNSLARNPEAVLAYPDFCIINEHSQTVKTVTTPDYDPKLLIAHFRCLPGPGALFRREAWLAAGDWSTALRRIPDMEFFLRLCRQGPFQRVPESLADFRLHSASTTYTPATKDRAEEPLQVVTAFFRQKDMPGPLLRWRRQSTCHAMLLSGFMHGYSGRHLMFIRRMCKAFFIHPSVSTIKTMGGYVLTIFKSKAGMLT